MGRTHFALPKHRLVLVNVLIIPTVLALFALAAFYIYRFIDPYASLNPLNREVTSGQTVVGNWIYDGMNNNGDIVFYKNGDYVPLIVPVSSHEFAIDGQTFILENATRNSLTFATPIESVFPWTLVPLGIIALMFVISLRKRKTQIFFKAKRVNGIVPALHWADRTKRFRRHR